MEIVAKASKRLNDAGQDSLTLCHGVTRFLIILSNISSLARVGKGTLRVPLGQGVANGGIDKEFFTSGRNGENVPDGIPKHQFEEGPLKLARMPFGLRDGDHAV